MHSEIHSPRREIPKFLVAERSYRFQRKRINQAAESCLAAVVTCVPSKITRERERERMESARLAGNIVVGEQKRKGSHRSAVPCLRWRDSTRRALALVFIFIFQNSHPRPIVPLNTLCRMRRLAYNVAALRPPSELVIAR